jgi:hypothetical protein
MEGTNLGLPVCWKPRQGTFWTGHFKSLTAIQKILRLLLFLVVLPLLVTVLALLASIIALRTLPKVEAVWFVYSIPALASVLAWIDLCRRVGDERQSFPVVVAVAVATASTLLGVGPATYLRLIGDMTFQTWRAVLGLMLLISFLGFIAGIILTARSPPIVLRLSAVCINMDACTFFAFLGGSVGSVLI